MRWKILLLIAVAFVAAFWFVTRPQSLAQADLATGVPDLDNGAVVFHAGGCAACHGEDLAGGLEMTTPFGTFNVPNISPDPDTGIGAWSELDFANAMLLGVSPEGKHYYPAFPYPSYTRMDMHDLHDLKAYLDRREPLAKEAPGHDLSFPFNIRRGIGFWKQRYVTAAPIVADEQLPPNALRGRYLAEALGHCGECHTPRDRFGGPDYRRWLAGGPNPDGEGRVPNITPHESGLAGWSENDIAYYLESGFTPEFDTVGGSMVKVQENFARLSDQDRQAVAAYLKAVAAHAGEH
ncbi:MAG: cytochrome c [Gammaproteobacteria bacterium]|nr:cytochrome c [Gammaproteobacteria bacterium]